MPMLPPPSPPKPSTTTTNTDRRISPHTPHHNQRTRTGKPTASFQRPQQTCRRQKHARQRGPSNVDHLVDVVVDAVRPSMAGWWSCCQCEGMNNPALSPESCTLCSHYRCQSCGNIAWCGCCWLAGFVFAFRFFALLSFLFLRLGVFSCIAAPWHPCTLWLYTLCISRISGTPLRGSKIECFDEVVMTRNNVVLEGITKISTPCTPIYALCTASRKQINRKPNACRETAMSKLKYWLFGILMTLSTFPSFSISSVGWIRYFFYTRGFKAGFSFYPRYHWSKCECTFQTAVIGTRALLERKQPIQDTESEYLLEILESTAQVKWIVARLCLKDSKHMPLSGCGFFMRNLRPWRDRL